MTKKTIYLCLAHMSEAGLEQKYIKEAFDTNWVVPLGPNVNAFEEDLERFVNNENDTSYENENENENCRLNRKVVALSAGTAAIHLALIACGVQAGDEVCVQSFTFCASSHPITYLGARPVFIDSERDSWNMDPDLLEKAIEDRIAVTGRKPKAIIPVALYGMPYNIERIMEIANRYEIPVIEDAAEGFGSRWKGRVLGTFGRYGVLSFNGNKMITTSGGGALICNGGVANNENENENRTAYENENENENRIVETAADAANRIMWYATQARDSYPYYQHSAIGYNYRMSNICAGIGRGQMTVAEEHIAHHKHVQGLYRELLKGVDGVTLHEAPSEEYDSNYWLCTVTLDPSLRVKGQENAYKEVVKSAVGGAAGVINVVDSPTTDCQPNENVEAMRVFMLERKIEARPVWKPMHKQPVYNRLYENEDENENKTAYENEDENENYVCCEGPKSCAYLNGVSEEIFKKGMCLPAGPCVSDDDVRYIVECIKEAIVDR